MVQGSVNVGGRKLNLDLLSGTRAAQPAGIRRSSAFGTVETAASLCSV